MSHVDSESTGEPPTVHTSSVLQSELSMPAPVITSAISVVNSQHEAAQTTGTMLQELDSGYEASPSSTAGNSSFNFDQMSADIEAEYDDSVMTFHMDDEISQFIGEPQQESNVGVAGVNCPQCDSFGLCYYNINSVSSGGSINFTGDEGRNLSSSEQSVGRASSLPIAIPLRSSSISYLPLHSSATGSNSLIYGQLAIEQRRNPQPMSWPFVPVMGAGRGTLWHISRSMWPRIGEAGRYQSRAIAQDRRRLIDSDASSLSSSDGDGPEDVFDTAEALQTISVNTFGVSNIQRQEQPPELVPPNSSQRSRSVSVNLPPVPREMADMIVRVGRSLRRLSDEFSRQREARNGGTSSRRFTVGDFVHYPSSARS